MIVILMVGLFNLFQGSGKRTAQQDIPYSDFMSFVEQGTVSKVTIEGQKITGQYKTGTGSFTVFAPNDPNLRPRPDRFHNLARPNASRRASASDTGGFSDCSALGRRNFP